MSDEFVCCRRDGPVWSVLLNRPEKANALSQSMLHQLHDIFKQAAIDPDIRVLTIQGAGERVFCAGADLIELSTNMALPENAIWAEMPQALGQLPILTIALINGACFGGGISLALGCDIRISVDHAKFGYPVLRNRVIPALQDCQRLKNLVGAGRMNQLFLAGQTISAKTASSWGLVDLLEPNQTLESSASKLSAAAIDSPLEYLEALKTRCNEN